MKCRGFFSVCSRVIGISSRSSGFATMLSQERWAGIYSISIESYNTNHLLMTISLTWFAFYLEEVT